MSALDDLAIQVANVTGYSIGQSLFKGNLPPTPDNAIAIINPPGEQPNKYLPEKSPMFKILIRDDDYSNGELKLAQIRASLQARTPQTIGQTYFFWILATSEGGWIHRDETGRDMWSINFTTRTR